MTSLKRPQRDAQVAQAAPAQPGPAPSVRLLGEFASRSAGMRDEAATCTTQAAAERQAAQLAQADADQMSEQLRALLAEVERVKQAMDAKAAEADEHRVNAERHGEKAAELMGDAAWMDEVNARAGRLPAFQPTCCCNPLPGAPDAEERRAACPIHGSPGPVR